jgi:hypothetical protein
MDACPNNSHISRLHARASGQHDRLRFHAIVAIVAEYAARVGFEHLARSYEQARAGELLPLRARSENGLSKRTRRGAQATQTCRPRRARASRRIREKTG